MHNLQQRVNAVFAFAVSVFFSLLAAVALLSYISPLPQPTAEVMIGKVQVVTGRYGADHFDYGKRTNEFAVLSFNLNADLQPLFNWNTKQLFVSLVAEYETTTHNHNQVVVWDAIIDDKRNAVLKLRERRNKYTLIDFSTKWEGLAANFSLHYDLTPYVGVLRNGVVGTSKTVHFPAVEARR
ncbi:hypothetical protein BC937DRAFT_90445 [Endogone sp. FLAS-F59071]|nr:hypothetical protein BC937DRAFT_90445 [Endogone sp. FLAS-F59071]|eukprot:RUS17083.1 hypothetical protein BC937DRAFT_90445 [Endogone sp. FLAS-F59071]